MCSMTLDLTAARKLLADVQACLDQLDGTVLDVDYDRGRTRNAGPSPKRNEQAAVARDLLRSAEVLSAASSEVSMAYWNFKGFADPRS